MEGGGGGDRLFLAGGKLLPATFRVCVCVRAARVSPFWVPPAAAASFPPAPVYLCVYLSLLKSLPAANFPGSPPPAHRRATHRFAGGRPPPPHHVSARAQALFHHRVAGGQRQPLARVSLRGSHPPGGSQLCQFQPDEPFSQRLPLHRQGGLLQPGLGLCGGRLPPAEPGRARAPRAPSPRPGRPSAASLALHAPALRFAAKGSLHLLPVANTSLPVSGPQVPRYVKLCLVPLRLGRAVGGGAALGSVFASLPARFWPRGSVRRRGPGSVLSGSAPASVRFPFEKGGTAGFDFGRVCLSPKEARVKPRTDVLTQTYGRREAEERAGGVRVPAVARPWPKERRETQRPAQGRPEEMGLRRAAQREETGATRWRTTSAGKEPNLWRKMNNPPPPPPALTLC